MFIHSKFNVKNYTTITRITLISLFVININVIKNKDDKEN